MYALKDCDFVCIFLICFFSKQTVKQDRKGKKRILFLFQKVSMILLVVVFYLLIISYLELIGGGGGGNSEAIDVSTSLVFNDSKY